MSKLPPNTLARFRLLVVILMSGSCAIQERTLETVHLERAAIGHDAGSADWERFEQVCEVHAIHAGARRVEELDSSPWSGCRYWSQTRPDATILFAVEACPEDPGGPSPDAATAIVHTWPRWWNPTSSAEAEDRRAALYDALRAEFGDRVRVVRR